MNDKGNRYAISALRDKRATIASEIVSLERQVRHKREQLVHVDACLALLDPQSDPSEIPNKRLPKHVNLFRSGELGRIIMTAFRNADGQALATREIVDAVIRDQAVGEDARRAIAPRVRTNLSYLARRGKLIKIGNGTAAKWQLA